jgi:hypothetical protein
MMRALDISLDHLNSLLLLLLLGATLVRPVTKSALARIIGGVVVIAIALIWHISTRSAYAWSVSALERTSVPGFLLLGALIYSTLWRIPIHASPEFRFGTFALIVAGLVLYPGAVGIINFDPYVPGYSGLLLPVVVAILMGYMLWRGFYWSALALNAAVAAFLLGAGRSANLWDYLVDPAASVLSLLCWIAILVGMIPFARIFGRSPPAAEPAR